MHIVPVPSFDVTLDPDPLEDRAITLDEAQLIRSWMMRDECPSDEAPTLEDGLYFEPSDADAAFWSRESRRVEPSTLDLWLPEPPPVESHRLLSHAHASPELAVAITETEPQGEAKRYAVRSYSGGIQVAVQPFDTIGDAQAYLRHVLATARPEKALSAAWVMPGEDGLTT